MGMMMMRERAKEISGKGKAGPRQPVRPGASRRVSPGLAPVRPLASLAHPTRLALPSVPCLPPLLPATHSNSLSIIISTTSI